MLLFFALACKPEPVPPPPVQPDPLSWSIAEAGPYGVGFQSWAVSYTTLLGVSRTVTMNAWYPTEDTTGEPTSHLDIFVWDDIFEGASLASPAAPEAGYPVHVHSHGNVMFAGHAPRSTSRTAALHCCTRGPG